LTVVSAEGMTRITSTEIESIISGRNTERCTQLFPHDSVKYWNFDIANCRGMVCMARERVWRVFELSKYRQLFKIPYNESHTLCFQGEIDLLLYEVISRVYPGVERFFKIYCKLSGKLKKQFSLPGSQFDCITSCGRDRLLIHPPYPECMQIVDISSDIPRLIETTVCSFGRAFCLNKSSQFICKAKIDNSNKYDVENPQGESSGSVTSKYGVHVFNLEGERSVTLKDFPHSSLIRFIPRNEDVAILVSTIPLRININSLLTGQSLLSIKVNDSMISWRVSGMKRFAYDERTHEMFMLNIRGKPCICSNKLFEHE